MFLWSLGERIILFFLYFFQEFWTLLLLFFFSVFLSRNFVKLLFNHEDIIQSRRFLFDLNVIRTFSSRISNFYYSPSPGSENYCFYIEALMSIDDFVVLNNIIIQPRRLLFNLNVIRKPSHYEYLILLYEPWIRHLNKFRWIQIIYGLLIFGSAVKYTMLGNYFYFFVFFSISFKK